MDERISHEYRIVDYSSGPLDMPRVNSIEQLLNSIAEDGWCLRAVDWPSPGHVLMERPYDANKRMHDYLHGRRQFANSVDLYGHRSDLQFYLAC